ncbi:MAG: type II toxin-antitoxin system HicB family antitoxin [Candidatus Brocadia sinica]|nr:type II toxin-antitoxin system HicB family antitoxin [Candidatus Brocadia sinica]NUO06605.1 type II toxin-antitoxin system HicB family antitoxin [Candidatus Brocadia sinica]
MSESQYEMIIYWDKTDNIYVVEVPELPGCIAHGKSKKEALENAEKAVEFWLKTAKEDGIQIPVPKGRLMYA